MLRNALAALIGGFLGVLVAAAAGWYFTFPLPLDADAQQLAGPASVVTDRSDLPYDFRWRGGREYTSGLVALTVPDGNSATLRDSLAASGWSLRTMGDNDFWAERDGLTVEARAVPDGLDVAIRRAQPPVLRVLGPLGWLLGAAAGVFLFGRAIRRSTLALAGSIMLLPMTGYAVWITATYVIGLDRPSPAAPWVPLADTPIALLSWAGAALLITGAVRWARAVRHEGATDSPDAVLS